jgi:RNA polymerase sigma-70 factor, ECF subfamily
MSQQTEPQLQAGAATITSSAFAELHDRCRGRLLNSMIAVTRNREEAEDITATAFAAAFKNLGAFRGEASLPTWIHAIALNEARSRRRGPVTPLESIDQLDAGELSEPDLLTQKLERADCCARIREALRRVPRLYRETLVDHFVRGQSVKQIAKCRRIPLGTVLSRLFKAKQLLRAAWEA